MEDQDYIIPLNYMDGGTTLNGMARKRNVFEGVIIALILLLIAFLLPIPDGSKVTVYVLVGGLGFLFGCHGINGDPVSSFIMDAFKWIGRRSPYIYNNHGESFSVSAGELMLSRPQFGDALADMIDKMRERMAARRTEYIEGKTFRFAEDPELVALRNAEKRKNTQPAEKAKPAKATTKKAKKAKKAAAAPTSQPAATNNLDIDALLDNIVLQDDDGKGGSV